MEGIINKGASDSGTAHSNEGMRASIYIDIVHTPLSLTCVYIRYTYTYTHTHTYAACKMFASSVFYAMGVPSEAAKEVARQHGPSPMPLEGWASESMLNMLYYDDVPFTVRWFSQPSWDKRYQQWRLVIESCWKEEDVLHIQA